MITTQGYGFGCVLLKKLSESSPLDRMHIQAGWLTGNFGWFFGRRDVAQALYFATDADKLLLDALVAAIHMVNAGEDGLSIGNQGGQNQRSRGAQVGAHDGGGGEACGGAPRSRTSIHFFVCAPADQLLHMHEPVLEDVFADLADALGLRSESHVLGLHVGGKAGIFLG